MTKQHKESQPTPEPIVAHYPECPDFEVGDKLKMRNNYSVYEVAKINDRGVYIWAQDNQYMAHGFCYPAEELKTKVTWVKQLNGTVWDSPPDPSDAHTKF